VLSRAQLNKAEHDYQQARDLYAMNLISVAEMLSAKTSNDVAKAQLDSSLAQIRRTEGSVSQAANQLSKTAICAPMDGTISSLTSEVGERVVGTGTYAGTEIMRVAHLDKMEVNVSVNENDIINVKIADRIIINVDAFPDRNFFGQVAEISPAATACRSSTMWGHATPLINGARK
jgi:HlyD family secretion protein